MGGEKSVVMIGATGAVGGHVVATLLRMPQVTRLTLLGRRPLEGIPNAKVAQHTIDVFDAKSYDRLLPGHNTAVCTLGVGEPSKVPREEFIRIDKDVPLAFGKACKAEGISHFELLSSVGVNSRSRNFFLRSKGELEDGLRQMNFERLSLFHPSMILTPQNRYGFSQAVTLALWPLLTPLLISGLRKFRGVKVERLGQAIAWNVVRPGRGVEVFEWDDFQTIAKE